LPLEEDEVVVRRIEVKKTCEGGGDESAHDELESRKVEVLL